MRPIRRLEPQTADLSDEQYELAKDQSAAATAALILADKTPDEALEALAETEEFVTSTDFAILDESDRADIRRILPHLRTLVVQVRAQLGGASN